MLLSVGDIVLVDYTGKAYINSYGKYRHDTVLYLVSTCYYRVSGTLMLGYFMKNWKK